MKQGETGEIEEKKLLEEEDEREISLKVRANSLIRVS